jgi:hypothetical protein
MSFTEKRHVQIANNPRPPQSRTEAELLYPSRPPPIFRYFLPLKVLSSEMNPAENDRLIQ